MDRAEHPTPRSDYLSRLTELATGTTAGASDPAGDPVVRLRPRLPSRFEPVPESAAEPEVWSELEIDAPARERATINRTGESRPPLPPASLTTGEPRPVPRRRAEREAAPMELPADVLPKRSDAPLREGTLAPNVRSESTAPAPMPRLRPVPAQMEAPEPAAPALQPGSKAEPIEPSTQRGERPNLREVVSHRQDPAELEAGPRERAPLPRATLRPVPPPPPTARNEPSLADAPLQDTGQQARAGRAAREEHRSEPLPPVINVTIGRIEVRAPVAPPAPLPPPEAPRPAISLEEYLQRRADGRF